MAPSPILADPNERRLRAGFGRLRRRLREIKSTRKTRLTLQLTASLASRTFTISALQAPDAESPGQDGAWFDFLRTGVWSGVAFDQLETWLDLFYALNARPALAWADDGATGWQALTVFPKIELRLLKPARDSELAPHPVEALFDYGGHAVALRTRGSAVLDFDKKQVFPRDRRAEQRLLLDALTDTPVRIFKERQLISRLELTGSAVNSTALQWLRRKLRVTDDGRPIVELNHIHLSVATRPLGFEVTGRLEFADVALQLPELPLRLDVARGLVELDGGMTGCLNPAWTRGLNVILKLGRNTPAGFQFQTAQGPILAALFADYGTDHEFDAPFQRLVENFRRYRTIKPQLPCRSFRGNLRHYQKEGLGWLSFLAETGFGGILADDMGLGKTVQVIAHLSAQYEKNPKAPLSLVILPKSLLFNWEEEIAKFAPNVKAAVYQGSQKRPLFSQLKDVQVLLITYNALRQDIESLKALEFHYVIADEAQAIKNSSSLIHQACLQIKARHRLAMSGTPVENSVYDLFSIFDFVSPGLIGDNLKIKAIQSAARTELDDLSGVAGALKPFILRRTKEQVLKDLPAKTEKVLFCKMSPPELKRYNEIRAHFKAKVTEEVRAKGLGQSGFAVLEGLLRLRQAASHPGLVDAKWADEPSSKLESFMEQLGTVMSMGHKALVFSQFTTLLDIVAQHLKKAGLSFVRIDGSASSRKRQASVKTFQTTDSAQVFLISLKAGGTGLNLTAADYVFILDPWWNPAAEAQAIDRAHRMGQKNKVMAYRMITKGTVEEKILALQKSKRDLASALVSSDSGLLKSLTHADIEALFS